jgi:hypothetical protein
VKNDDPGTAPDGGAVCFLGAHSAGTRSNWFKVQIDRHNGDGLISRHSRTAGRRTVLVL